MEDPKPAEPTRRRRGSVTAEGEARGAAARSARPRLKKAGKATRKRKIQKLVRRLGGEVSAVLNGSSAKLGYALRLLAAVVSGLFALVALVAALQTLQSSARDFTFAAIGILCAAAGLAGSRKLNRELLMLYAQSNCAGATFCQKLIALCALAIPADISFSVPGA